MKPKTSAQIDEMFRTGKTLDAAIARATRKAAAEARRAKPAPRSSRPRSKRAA